MTAAHMDAGMAALINARLDAVLETRNRLLRELQHSVATLTKAHNDAARVLAARLRDMGVPAEEVAYAATRKAGLMPGGKELADDGNGGGFHRRSAQGMRIPRSAAVTLRMPPSAFMSSKCHHSDSMTRKPAFFIAVWRRVTRRAISGSPPV